VVIARSTKQSKSSRSVAEAELYAFVAGMLAVEYVMCVLKDYDVEESVIIIHGDNKACLGWATSHVTNQATKHFIREVRYAQEIVERLGVRVQYVPSANNLADVFTKHLAGAQIRPLLQAMGVGEESKS
jgi:histone deacetylase 1/2